MRTPGRGGSPTKAIRSVGGNTDALGKLTKAPGKRQKAIQTRRLADGRLVFLCYNAVPWEVDETESLSS
jgi:hypothetical protein